MNQIDGPHPDPQPGQGEEEGKAAAVILGDQPEDNAARHGPEHGGRAEKSPFRQGHVQHLEEDGHGDGEDDQVITVQEVRQEGRPEDGPAVGTAGAHGLYPRYRSIKVASCRAAAPIFSWAMIAETTATPSTPVAITSSTCAAEIPPTAATGIRTAA